jgi:acyl carrier protein
MKFKKIIIIIILITLIFSLSGCYENNDNNERIIFNYSIYIGIGKESDFEIIAPIPLNQNGSISKINNFLKLNEGVAEYDLITSEKGQGLKIKSNQNLEIIAKGEKKLDIEIEDEKPRTQLSLLFDENNNGIMDEYNYIYYWFYLNSTHNNIINISISFRVTNDLGSSASRISMFAEGQISGEGWQKIEGKKNYKSID